MANQSKFNAFINKLVPQRVWVQLGFLLVWLDPFGLRFHNICAPVFHCYSCPLATFACPIGVLANFSALHLFPFFAVGMLMARKVGAASNPLNAIFASRNGTWLSPNNVRRQWRQARAETDLGWVTPHTFRKTVATLIDREADAKTAAAQLGHGSEDVTTTYYIEKAALAPDVSDVSDVLEVLGGNPESA